MRYHEMKIRDAKKLAAFAVAGAFVFLVGLIFRSTVEPLLKRVPLKSDEPYVPLMAALALIVMLCLGMAIWYLCTSPAQNAKYLNRMREKGRKIPEQFDWTLLDEANPHFHVSTWQYLRKRMGERQ